MSEKRPAAEFYLQDVLEVAPKLLGMNLMRSWPDGRITQHIISETEAYRGAEDEACHASKGRTPRTEIMYAPGGVIYMYLIYGMYWMLNIVTAEKNIPQAVLIRGLQDVSGPGRLTRKLEIDGSFYGKSLVDSDQIWIEPAIEKAEYATYPRIGIDYAGEVWKKKAWRYLLI